MHPIFLVAKREFSHRVRQRIFWVFLLLGPLFFLLILIVPIGLSMDKETSSLVAVVDKSGQLGEFLYSDQDQAFILKEGSVEKVAEEAKKEHCSGIVWIEKKDHLWNIQYARLGLLGSKNATDLKLVLQKRIDNYEMNQEGIDPPIVRFTSSLLPSEDTDSTIGFVAGLFLAMLTLVFVNQYSQMVLRGVVEEKQNRISELILTSIRPTHFIMGKVLGIASVAFLQMAIWFGSTGIISLTMYKYFKLERFSNTQLLETLRSTTDVDQTMEMNTMMNALSSLDYSGLLIGFLFYFVFGYLLFSALFAMIGIAVGNDSDAHQMAMPIALPLALPLVLLQSLVDDPNSKLAHFLSVFPLTSPTTMMIRLPLGVPTSELLLSGTILVASFLLASFSAAKVYRIGILLYGKKLGWRELWQWTWNS